jgi:hypothetical protein
LAMTAAPSSVWISPKQDTQASIDLARAVSITVSLCVLCSSCIRPIDA